MVPLRLQCEARVIIKRASLVSTLHLKGLSGLANGDAGAFGNQTVIEAPYGLSLGNARDQIWNDAI